MKRFPPMPIVVSALLISVLGCVIAFALFTSIAESISNPTCEWEFRVSIGSIPVLLYVFWHWFKTVVVIWLGLSRVGLVIFTILSMGIVIVSIKEGCSAQILGKMSLPFIAMGVSCVLCFLPKSNSWFRQKRAASMDEYLDEYRKVKESVGSDNH